MKALELLYQYQQADEIAGGYMSEPIGEAIKELESLNTTQQTTQSKFKVGDWVVYTGGGYCDGEILQITKIDEKGFCTFGKYNKLYHFNKLRRWRPKPNEWCWVFNDKAHIPVLRKFVSVNNIEAYPYKVESEHSNSTVISYKYIEPFIGSLPSTIEQY